MSRRRAVPFDDDDDDDDKVEPIKKNGDHDDDDDDDDDDDEPASSRKRKQSSASTTTKNQKKKKSQKNNKKNNDDDDDDDDDGAAFEGDDADDEEKPGRVRLSVEEEQKLVASLMRYALAMDLTKQPITREGINKTVLAAYSGSRVLPQLLIKASALFQRMFAYDLVPLARVDASTKRSVALGAYALTSTLPPEIRALIPQRDQTYEHLGLLSIIVAVLFLNDGQMTKQVLFAQLARLGLEPDTLHPTFGAWDKLIDTRFCGEQKYLTKTTQKIDKNVSEVVYSIGPRARAELDERQMLHFISQVYDHNEIDERALSEMKEVQVARDKAGGVAWAKEEPLRPNAGDAGGAPAAVAAAAAVAEEVPVVQPRAAAGGRRVMARRGRAAAAGAAAANGNDTEEDEEVEELEVSGSGSRRATPQRRAAAAAAASPRRVRARR